jgi:hypothetical protein
MTPCPRCGHEQTRGTRSLQRCDRCAYYWPADERRKKKRPTRRQLIYWGMRWLIPRNR